jgi:predicted RNA-binding Zn ribbon-like protein
MNAPNTIFQSRGFGKVAPWVDLANSLEWDGFGKLSDHLDDPRWLASFLRHWRFRPGIGESAPLARLVRLRSLLRRMAESIGTHQTLTAAEAAALNATLSAPGRQRLVQQQNGYRTELIPIHTNWNWILSRIAASAAETLTTGEAERIKICANNDCRWLFHDPTKARTKRWCSDKTCGNRDRVRRSRAAQAR